MQDQNANSGQNGTANAVAERANQAAGKAAQGDFVRKIAEKVKSSENILIVLSKEPSIDEIAAAIGLTLFLDGMQRHVTALYSGQAPGVLTFLQPEATFETNTDSLQDFIIALDKEKADHLRYKLEGDFVKVFITPYKTTISEQDLTFSRGDYNVNFVIALNVRSMGDLDPAIGENTRVLHDAATVNITTGDPGRFGEIEWSNPAASSVSEMVTELIFGIQGNDRPLDKDVATALLAGIVAATDRFSNSRTNSDTLSLASKLMTMGADQQLISANIQMAPAPMSGAGRSTNEAEPTSGTGTETGVSSEAASAMNPANSANPAAQIAQGMALTEGPEPVTMTTPTVALNANGEPMATRPSGQGRPDPANTLPFDANNTVIQPTAPGVEVAPMVNPDAPRITRPMATTQPVMSHAPVNGVAVQPPRPTDEPEKDYASMMEKVLSEDTPVEMPQPQLNVVQPGEEATALEGGLPGTTTGLPPNPGAFTIPGTMSQTAGITGAEATGAGAMNVDAASADVAGPMNAGPELAEKPVSEILPPPPAPVIDGAMPPSLPPVA